MESTDLHQHHHQLQQDQPPTLEPSSLSTITTPSSFFHGGGSGTNHSWTPNIILYMMNRNSAGGNNNPRSRADLTDNNDVIGAPPIQDFGYHHHQHHQWTTTTSDDAPQSCLTATSKLLTKEEIINLPKFSCEMLSIPSTIEAYAGLVTTTNHMNNNDNGDDDLNEKLLLKNLLSGGDFYSRTNNNYYYYYPPPHGEPRRGGNFSQIYPSINISNNYSTAALALVSSPMEESLDLLTTSSSPSTSFTANTTAAALTRQHLASVTFPDNPSFRLDHMQHHHHTVDMSSCTTTSNNSASSSHLLPNGTAEAVAKRPCSSTSTSSMELESSSSLKASQTPSKKSRSESRPSPSPPFKVRKEKLGDRIAALQQLVAPFGKTDTASVLMEAIGYIKFLQSQVETLSVPYMKSSQNQSKRVKQGGSGCMGGVGKDLGSRGLCLVPLSCMSYIAGDAATDVWQHHPNFGGPT